MFLHPRCPSWPSVYIYIYICLIDRWVFDFLSLLTSSHWHLDLQSAFLLSFVRRKKVLFPCMSTKLWIILPLYLNILSMFLIHSTLNASVTSIYFIVLSSDPMLFSEPDFIYTDLQQPWACYFCTVTQKKMIIK